MGENFLNNEYIYNGLLILLIIYAAFFANELPNSIANLFGSPLFNLLLFIIIVYLTKLDPAIGIIAAIGVLISIITFNKQHTISIKKEKGTFGIENKVDELFHLEQELQESEEDGEYEEIKKIQPSMNEQNWAKIEPNLIKKIMHSDNVHYLAKSPDIGISTTNSFPFENI